MGWKDAPVVGTSGWASAPLVSDQPTETGGETVSVPYRPKVFTTPEDRPARMIMARQGMREVPKEGPVDRGIYQLGGWATDKSMEAGAPPEVAAAVGGLTNLAAQAGTSFIGGGAGSRAVPALESAGRRMMLKALEPPIQSVRSGKADVAVRTLLAEDVGPTMAGLSHLRSRINDLNVKIKNLTDNSTLSVQVGEIGTELASLYNKAVKSNLPEKELDAIRTAWKQFRMHPMVAGRDDIPLSVAQELKQGTYKKLGDRPYERVMNPSGTAAEMALARGEREAIARLIPEVHSLNSAESKLLAALNLAERRALLDMSRGPGSFAFLTANPVQFSAYMASKSGAFRALIARYLHNYADPTALGTAVGMTAATASGRAPE